MSLYVCLCILFVYLFVCKMCSYSHQPSRKSVKHSHCNSSREKWGYFELECMAGGEWGLEGEVAICCDEKKMGTRVVLLLRLQKDPS